jgi:hypothetical protein
MRVNNITISRVPLLRCRFWGVFPSVPLDGKILLLGASTTPRNHAKLGPSIPYSAHTIDKSLYIYKLLITELFDNKVPAP